MSIGINIVNILNEKNISVYKLAEESKVSNSYLSEIINGKKSNPSIKILKRIADVLGVSIEDLVNERIKN